MEPQHTLHFTKIPNIFFNLQLVLALNGKDGEVLWRLQPDAISMASTPVVDLYTVRENTSISCQNLNLNISCFLLIHSRSMPFEI